MNAPFNNVIVAKFNPLIRPYLVATIGFGIAATSIGLPLALIWFLGVGQWWARHYFHKLECHLSEKSLRYCNKNQVTGNLFQTINPSIHQSINPLIH